MRLPPHWLLRLKYLTFLQLPFLRHLGLIQERLVPRLPVLVLGAVLQCPRHFHRRRVDQRWELNEPDPLVLGLIEVWWAPRQRVLVSHRYQLPRGPPLLPPLLHPFLLLVEAVLRHHCFPLPLLLYCLLVVGWGRASLVRQDFILQRRLQ